MTLPLSNSNVHIAAHSAVKLKKSSINLGCCDPTNFVATQFDPVNQVKNFSDSFFQYKMG